MSIDESGSPTGRHENEPLTAEERAFLDFIADRALDEWLKRPPANDNNTPIEP